MTKKTIKTSVQKDYFDPLVKVSFKIPFSVREQLKKQTIYQGKSLDKFMEELINQALTK